MNDIAIVRAVSDDQALVANLLEFYIYDFSELLGLEVPESGQFGYEHLSRYWSESGRHVFLVRKCGRLAGLIMVQKARELWEIAEFFVVRVHRRRGVAVQAAKEVWAMFPGRWQVRVRQRNDPAMRFWHRTVADFTGYEVCPKVTAIEGEEWSIYTFGSNA